ncbi:MAG: polymerase sigma-70 factor, subfamily [Alphaproteobacteria bacterium]|jgi:RNA polymerase sigma-70 factor (ECF subfamily)|nr:polymerase sigma-70 factor, subfamily [Alphaproteobacteria bacterium]
MPQATAKAAPLTAATSDGELLERARLRDEQAFRLIMQRNNRRLYRIARGVLRNDSEAEDVVQETYCRAFAHLDGFRGESSLATWLARIAFNEALGRLRQQRPTVDWTTLENTRPESQVLNNQVIAFPMQNQIDPERTMAQREIQRLLEQAIDDLPEAFRIVLVTRTIEGMSVEETADLLGLRPETVKTRLHRARHLLREALDKKAGSVLPDAFPFGSMRCERMTERVLARLQQIP